MASKSLDFKFLKRRAITSYGIILFTMDSNVNRNQLLYQLIQRKDSISYSEFLQDRLPVDKVELHIRHLMSKDEKRRCIDYYKKKDPQSLWDDLWVNHNSHVYKNRMKHCCEAFTKNMETYMEMFEDTDHGRTENTFGFPKGRKHPAESEINCALREFEEEVGISSKDIQVLDIKPFDEYYIGSDGKVYRTVCYVAYIPFIPETKLRKGINSVRNNYVSEEVSQIQWLSFSEAYNKLEDPHNKKLLSSVNKTLLFRRRRPRQRRATY